MLWQECSIFSPFYLCKLFYLLLRKNCQYLKFIMQNVLVKCFSKIFFSYIFLGFFCVYGVPLPPLRCQHMVLCHPRWLPTSGLSEFAVCWGEAGFKPRTTDLQSGALPLSHLSSLMDGGEVSQKYITIAEDFIFYMLVETIGV